MRRRALAAWILVCAPLSAARAELGHYRTGVAPLRDSLLPERAIQLTSYSSWYVSARLNDGDGHELRSIEVGLPGTGLTLPVNISQTRHVSQHRVAFVPLELESLGLRAGASAEFQWGRSAYGVTLLTTLFEDPPRGVLDPLFVPVWLGWSSSRLELALSYGIWAPWGDYDADQTLNLGRGFLTHQVQLTTAVHVDAERMVSLLARASYEIHGEQEGRDVRLGDTFTLEYGASLVPLDYAGLRLGVDLFGSSQLQVTDSSGGARARQPFGRSQVHAVGLELSARYLPWEVSGSLLVAWEYYAEAAFSGVRVGFGLRIDIPFRRRPSLPE